MKKLDGDALLKRVQGKGWKKSPPADLDKARKRETVKSMIKAGFYLDYYDNNWKLIDKEFNVMSNIDWIGKKSYVIAGNPGLMKTGQIAVICKELVGKYWVKYWDTGKLMRQNFIAMEQEFKLLEKPDLVVLDNFGQNVNTENRGGWIFGLIDTRLHMRRSTVIITNERLKDIVDSATYDRLEKMYDWIELDGKSKRGEK